MEGLRPTYRARWAGYHFREPPDEITALRNDHLDAQPAEGSPRGEPPSAFSVGCGAASDHSEEPEGTPDGFAATTMRSMKGSCAFPSTTCLPWKCHVAASGFQVHRAVPNTSPLFLCTISSALPARVP